MSQLPDLIRLFHDAPEDLGAFQRVAPDELPAAHRALLAHSRHMTVTVEKFHNSLVDVHVLAEKTVGARYARQILLRRQSDHAVVQFGIMRINFEHVTDLVRREIEARREPLGRILIRHNVLRRVELCALWQVIPGPALQQLFEQDAPLATFGRTALIHCDGEPAVELLEIVTRV